MSHQSQIIPAIGAAAMLVAVSAAGAPAPRKAATARPVPAAGMRAGAPVLATPTGDNEKPCLVARPLGGAYLAFAEREGEKTSVRFAVLRDGLHLDSPVRVSTEEMDLDLGAENGPTVAVDRTGRIYVAWVAGSWKVKGAAHPAHATGSTGGGKNGPPPRPGNLNIYLATSTDDGKTFSLPVRVNDDPEGAEHRFPTLAIGEQNTLHIAWLDKRKQTAEKSDFSRVFVARSTDGGKTFSRNVDATQGQETGICHCCRLSLVTHPRQGLVVAYRNDVHDMRDIFLAGSRDRGETFSTPRPIESFRWMIPACPFNGPSLAFDEPGRLYAAWMTGGSVPGAPAIGRSTGATYKVMYRSLDPASQSGSAPLFLAEGTHPRLVLDREGAAYIAWDGGGIHLARIGNTPGAKPTHVALVPSGRDVVFPSLTLATDGSLLVAWQRNDEDGRSQIYINRVAVGAGSEARSVSR